MARKEETPSLPDGTRALRQQLCEDGVLQERADGLLATDDYVLNSPSTAAAVVLGRSANGLIEWKTKDDTTLRELQEQALND